MTGPLPTWIGPAEMRTLAQAHLDGLATDDDVAVLESREDDWVGALRALRHRVQATIAQVERTVTGPERALVLADFGEERQRIDNVLVQLTGRPGGDEDARQDADARGGRDTRERVRTGAAADADTTGGDPSGGDG